MKKTDKKNLYFKVCELEVTLDTKGICKNTENVSFSIM